MAFRHSVLRLRPKFVLGVTLLAAILVIGAGLQTWSAGRWVSHTLAVQRAADDLLTATLESETGQRGYLLTGDPAYLTSYEQSHAAVRDGLAAVGTLVADNPSQTARLNDIDADLRAKLAEWDASIAAMRQGDWEAATASGPQSTEAVRAKIAQFEAAEARLLEERERRSRRSGLVLGGAAAIVLLGIGLLIPRQLATASA